MFNRDGILDYHRSINNELVALKNRVRDLLKPNQQWLEDGRHKEVVLRQVLRRYLPENHRLATGFVKLRESTTSQIDLMISNLSGPTLFKEDEFQIVTPNLVEAIVEVKTKLTTATFRTSVAKLADQVEKVRREKSETNPWIGEDGLPPPTTHPWAGLFAFEECDIKPEDAVHIAAEITQKKLCRAVQSICLGPDIFLRFWSMSPDPEKYKNVPAWHCYRLTDLAYAYFIGNVLWRHDDTSPEQTHWFPLEEGKEVHLLARVELETWDHY